MRKFLLIGLLFGTLHSQAQSNTEAGTVNGQAPILKPYPNPATSYINIDFQRSFEKGATIFIYKFMGPKVYEVPNAAERNSINLATFFRGLYIYQLVDRTGRILGIRQVPGFQIRFFAVTVPRK